MNQELVADDRGRVTLPPDMRRRHGQRYMAIDTPDGIHLFPIPKRGDTQWLGKPIPSSEYRRVAMEAAEKEVEDELRTIHGVKRGRKR